MRTHTPAEKALYDVRVADVRAWAMRVERAIDTRMLFARAHMDRMAMVTRIRQDLIYKVVLVEPTGEVPHHILNDTVWGHLREERRFAPTVFYEKATSQWSTLYGDTLPTDWRRAVLAANGRIEPSLVSDTLVPGGYRNIADAKVLEFLSVSGGRVIPLDEFYDPYPPLTLGDIPLTGQIGSVIRYTLAAVGGKPPLVYSKVGEIGDLTTRLNGNDLIVSTSGKTAGDYVGKVRVTDSLGATAEATLTVTLTAPPPQEE